MNTEKNTVTERIVRLSMLKSGKIAFYYLAFGVAWILVSDHVASRLFSHLQDLVYFSMIKGLVYVLLSTAFILHVSYINIKRILQNSATEMQDKQQIDKQRSILRALLNATPDLVFYKDTEHRYIGCNKAFAEVVGMTESEIVGKTDYDLFDAKTADLFRQMDLEMINSGTSKKMKNW